MRILVTNDDGIDAYGIRALESALRQHHDVIVCAPHQEQSAASHSLTLRRPLRLQDRGPSRFACDGTPTDCVLLAVQELFDQKPDLIVSGINHGQNMGQDVSYSGTVAAAKEGSIVGIPSIATSLVFRGETYERREHGFDAAAEFIAGFISTFRDLKFSPSTFLNINFPPLADGKGQYDEYCFSRLGLRVFRDVVVKREDPRGETYYWIAGEPNWEDIDGSDYKRIHEGRVSITPLALQYEDSPTLSRLDPDTPRTLT